MMNLKKCVKEMTLEEKAAFLSGKDMWHTLELPRLGIPSLLMTDGPFGVRCEDPNQPSVDGFNGHNSHPATCFPTSSALAASWNKELMAVVGECLGEEARCYGVGILLGPGINHKRLPIGGRNFEFFSEDPYLSGSLATQYVLGLQSTKTACSLKHFTANNTEYKRNTINEKIDERTLREIYLAPFEMVVKESHPVTVMSAYNRLNGDYCSESKRLLTEILREEWGFDGTVISDWGAVHDKVKSVKAGCDLDMPYVGKEFAENVVKAVRSGELSEEEVDKSVERLLDLVERFYREPCGTPNFEKGYTLAKQAAQEGMVLLKNDDNALPLNNETFCVIGERAKISRFQGAGSSRVKPYRVSVPMEELEKVFGAIEYAAGYTVDTDGLQPELIEEAVSLAKKHKKVLLFVGLNDKSETEAEDRKDMKLSEQQNLLIERVATVCENVTVILQCGSLVEMPWCDDVSAIVQAYLGGSGGGEALCEILCGKVCPSGRLAETYPMRLEDCPAMLYYMTDPDVLAYQEGIFTGYRYYDSKNVKTLFPFGHGLSYTTFSYQDFQLCRKSVDTVEVSVTVTNTGERKALETVQIYVSKPCKQLPQVKKELKQFTKVELVAGESKRVMLELTARAFSSYDAVAAAWITEAGEYSVSVCKDAEHELLSAKIVF